jgi:hypothetical protein
MSGKMYIHLSIGGSMPPSGFNPTCVAAALTFARECIEDLHKEVLEGKHQDLRSGIKFELNQLGKASMQESNEFKLKATRSSLSFIQGFYQDLDEATIENDNIDEVVEKVLQQLEEELLLVHIDEQGRLTQRNLQPSL